MQAEPPAKRPPFWDSNHWLCEIEHMEHVDVQRVSYETVAYVAWTISQTESKQVPIPYT